MSAAKKALDTLKTTMTDQPVVWVRTMELKFIDGKLHQAWTGYGFNDDRVWSELIDWREVDSETTPEADFKRYDVD